MVLCIMNVISINAWDGSAGKVYLQNVGSGLWWGAGNNWGTRASLLVHPEYVTLIADGTNFQMESQVSNGGTAYYFNGDYMDDGTPVSLIITQVGDYFTIANDNTYYGYDGSSTVLGKGVDASSDNGKWRIYSELDMVTLFGTATIESPVDATWLILDQGFGRNNRNQGVWTMVASNQNLSGGNNTNNCAESYHSTFALSQTISTHPAGVYKLTAQAFYRQDGSDNDNLPYFYINDATSTFPFRSGAENSMDDASVSFAAGNYKADAMYVQVTENQGMTVGAKLETNTGLWCIFDNFELTYYGDVTIAEVLLADYVKAYNAALSAAQAYQSQDMFDTDKTALNNAITDNTIDLSSATQESLTTATANLNAAAAAAAKAVAKYAPYAYAVANAVGNTNIDLTSALSNPSFETGDLTSWTSADGGNVATNENFSGKVGNVFVERWRDGGAGAGLSNGTLTYDVFSVPAGVYTFSVNAQNIEQYNSNAGGTGYFFYVNDEKVEISANNTYSLTIKLTEEVNDVVVKFALESCTGNWVSCDNLTLTFVADDLPDVTAVEGKMNNDVAAAQTSAIVAYDADKTVANFIAAVAAVAAAQASKDAYTVAAKAIADAKALKEAHNFAPATAVTALDEAIAAIETPYNEGTLSDADATAAGKTLGVVRTDWHAGANSAASNYLEAGFGLNDFDADLHINTWSNEGDNDGSGFSVPFYEYWTADANALGENIWTGTLTGLDNGLYTVSAWVRVRAKNETAATDATGITMDINGGGEGDYAAVDVTEGTQVGETQFQLKEYTAQSLVKDGTLKVNFNIAADNNISWLSFKHVKYTKIRDLTPDEEFVAATEEDYAALNAAIEAHTLGFEAGEYAPYNNVEALATITAAKAIDQTAENAQENVQAATAAITNATWTANTAEVNAVYDGSFEADYSGQTGNINPTGWQRVKGAAADGYNVRLMNGTNAGLAATTSGKALFTKQSAYYGYANGYTMPLKANTTYKVSFVYGGWGDCKKDGYVSMAAPDGSAVTLSATDLPVDATNADADANAWKSYEALFTTGEAGDYVLGLRKKSYDTSGQSQYVYGDIVIIKATADDIKDQLLAELNTANGIDTEANVGDAAFQIPATAATALTSGITDAQGVYDNGTATVEEVLQAIEDLKAAEDAYKNAEINAPAEGQLFNVVLTYGGWTYDNKAMTYIANGRTDAGFYNIQYTEVANQNLAQAFTFTKVEGNNYKMSQIDADGVARYISTGTSYGGDAKQIRTTTDADQALVVTVIPTATEGKWNLRNTEATDYIGSQDAGVYTVNSHIDFQIVETQKPSITINTTAAGWGTTMLPFAAEKPADVKVYSCAAVDGATLTLVEVSSLEANKPYIIEGAWNETLTGDAQGTALTYEEGLLTGTYERIPAPNGCYILQKQDEKVGFFKVDTEVAHPNVPANRAYLTVPASDDVKAFYFGDTTGINNLLNDLQNGSIYDLNGRKVQRMQKGNVYIVNGKKVVVK